MRFCQDTNINVVDINRSSFTGRKGVLMTVRFVSSLMFSSVTLSKIECLVFLATCVLVLLAGTLIGEAGMVPEFQLSLLLFFNPSCRKVIFQCMLS